MGKTYRRRAGSFVEKRNKASRKLTTRQFDEDFQDRPGRRKLIVDKFTYDNILI